MNTHIDTLDKWWENAEEGAARKGDTIIVRYDGDGEYGIRISDADLISHVNDIRILARAPKPKPAWHGAVAVMARCSDAPEGHREPFIRSEATRDVWAGEAGHARTEDLRDVTPLIEAKVTDEMVERIREASRDGRIKGYYGDVDGYYRAILTAALITND